MKIPLSKINIDDKEFDAMKKVLKSGWLTEGTKNIEFEEKFAKYIGVKRAITLNSGTSALQLALIASGIKGEVIVPSFTFVASANAVVTSGATPVFVDIDYNTCNIDPKKIEGKITDRTEAIMPVHFGGQACFMDEIMSIADRHDLKVIEDSAETIGGEYKGRKTGSFGIGCFSFFPTKNMTTGEGGMLTTDDEVLADKAKTLAAHGIAKGTLKRESEDRPWFREARLAGYNFRMSNLLAAIGVEQLKKLDEMNRLRRECASYLNQKLTFDEIDLPVETADCKHVYQMYTVKLKNIDRTKFIRFMREKGIGVSVHFDPPVHLQEFYSKRYGYKEGDFPVTEKVASSIVTLPLYPKITKRYLNYIADSIGLVLKEIKRR